MSKRSRKSTTDKLQNKKIKTLETKISKLVEPTESRYLTADVFSTLGSGTPPTGGFTNKGRAYSLLSRIPVWDPANPGVIPAIMDAKVRFGHRCVIKSLRFRGTLSVPYINTEPPDVPTTANAPQVRVRVLLVHMKSLGCNSSALDSDNGLATGGLHWEDVLSRQILESQYATRLNQALDNVNLPTPQTTGPTYKVLKDKTYTLGCMYPPPILIPVATPTQGEIVITSVPNPMIGKSEVPFFINLKWPKGMLAEWEPIPRPNSCIIKNDIYLLAFSDTPSTSIGMAKASIQGSFRIRWEDNL